MSFNLSDVIAFSVEGPKFDCSDII